MLAVSANGAEHQAYPLNKAVDSSSEEMLHSSSTLDIERTQLSHWMLI
jgi:hypothetical protein